MDAAPPVEGAFHGLGGFPPSGMVAQRSDAAPHEAAAPQNAQLPGYQHPGAGALGGQQMYHQPAWPESAGVGARLGVAVRSGRALDRNIKYLKRQTRLDTTRYLNGP